jgi:hypothetical protein
VGVSAYWRQLDWQVVLYHHRWRGTEGFLLEDAGSFKLEAELIVEVGLRVQVLFLKLWPEVITLYSCQKLWMASEISLSMLPKKSVGARLFIIILNAG